MITEYFTDDISIITQTRDRWQNTTETVTTVKGRLEKTDRNIPNAAGEDRQASYVVFLPKGSVVNIGDRIFDGVYTGTGRRWTVLNVSEMDGFDPDHVEVVV